MTYRNKEVTGDNSPAFSCVMNSKYSARFLEKLICMQMQIRSVLIVIFLDMPLDLPHDLELVALLF